MVVNKPNEKHFILALIIFVLNFFEPQCYKNALNSFSQHIRNGRNITRTRVFEFESVEGNSATICTTVAFNGKNDPGLSPLGVFVHGVCLFCLCKRGLLWFRPTLRKPDC